MSAIHPLFTAPKYVSQFESNPSPVSNDVWTIQVPHPPAQARESRGTGLNKLHQLENTIAFMTKQHAEVLQALHVEVEQLKTKNKELIFQLTMNSSERKFKDSKIVVSHNSSSEETVKVQALQDEIKKLKSALNSEKQKQIPVSNSDKSQRLLSRRRSSSSSVSTCSSNRESLIETDRDKILPFSLHPHFVVHPMDGPDRTPSIEECQAIISSLSDICKSQAQELEDLKTGLKGALYSQKWTPDAYLLAKAYIADDKKQPMLKGNSKSEKVPFRNPGLKLPDSVYSHKDHGSLPALRQTLPAAVIERQKKVQSMQKAKLRKIPDNLDSFRNY